MGFITNTSANDSLENSNTSINCVAFDAHNGDIVSCTLTEIVIDNSASAIDDMYNNCLIEITSGLGTGTIRNIDDYDGTSRTITVKSLGEPPDENSTYTIHKHSGIVQNQTQDGRRFKLKLPDHFSSVSGIYKRQMVRIIHENGLNESHYISDYDGTTKIITISEKWANTPVIGDFCIISGESGIAVTGTSNTITLDGNQSASVIVGLVVEIMKGTGSEQVRTISSISSDIITVDSDWDTIPDSTSEYRIVSGWFGKFESTEGYSQISYILSVGKRERVVITSVLSNLSTKSGAMYTRKESYLKNKITHSFSAKGNYFKLFIISLGTTLTGSIQTSKDFAHNKETVSIDDRVTDSTDCSIVRAVITGRSDENGQYRNIRTDAQGNLNVNIMQPRDVFDHLIVAEPKVLVELKFPYSTSHYTQDYFMKGTAFLLNTGNSVLTAMTAVPPTTPVAYSTSRLKSIHRSNYSSGLSLRITFSGIFSPPAAGCRQIIGHGDQNNGFFFGYNGLDFGVLRRYGGRSEIQLLTVTTGASTTGDVTVTLNGVSTTIPVVAGDSKYTVARKIAKGTLVAPYYLQKNYSYMHPGWLTYENNDSVHFLSEDSGSLSGTYSATGQGISATFTQIQAGLASTDEWTLVSDWNVDRIDGTTSIPVLDFTKGNIFEINMQWLGFGNISFKIENPINGHFSPVHFIKYPNKFVSPSLHVPHQPIMLEADNGSTTNFVSVGSASMASHVLGKHNIYNAVRFGTSEIKKQSVSGMKMYNILTLRNDPTIMSTTNVVEILGLSIASSWKANSASIFHAMVNSDLEIPYAISINTPGSGYNEDTVQKVTGGSGTGMEVRIIDTGGSGDIQEIVIERPGSGYVEQDTITVLGGSGGTVDVTHSGLTWVHRKANVSVTSICKDFVEVTGGEEHFSIAMGSDASFFETFNDMEIYMPPMYTLTLAIQPIADEINAQFSSSFFWSEKM